MCGWGEGGLGGGGGRKERKQNNNNRWFFFFAVLKNAATVHKMGHYPSTVYHYVVDKSMALTVMTRCYSKPEALRQSPCLLWRLQQGSTRGKGTHSQEGVCVRIGVWQRGRDFWAHLHFLCLCAVGCENVHNVEVCTVYLHIRPMSDPGFFIVSEDKTVGFKPALKRGQHTNYTQH